MIWARAASTPDMHAIASVHSTTALAYCRATWPTYDTVELDNAPGHSRRCEGCVRVLVDRRCIELGLDELLSATEAITAKTSGLTLEKERQ